MDLSKEYDRIPHHLLIAKIEAYNLGRIILNLLLDCLHRRKQRNKIGSAFSDWWEILTGVPQGSILEPMLFNIFINDLFLFISRYDICSFADDNTLNSYDKVLGNILENLKFNHKNILSWCDLNSMKANPRKF